MCLFCFVLVIIETIPKIASYPTTCFFRFEMLKNIVLAGGNTLFPGLPDRIANKMSSHLLTEERGHLLGDVKVIAAPERKEAVWIGGSVLASLSDFQERSISREKYLEHGSHFINVKEQEKEEAWKAGIIERKEELNWSYRFF